MIPSLAGRRGPYRGPAASRRLRWPKAAIALGALLLFAAPPAPEADARVLPQAQPGEWSVPRRIPDYGDNENAPLLVADQNRTVHAFNLGTNAGGDNAIFYRSWSVSQGWSAPVDVILPSFLGVAPTLDGAFLDSSAVIHLIYSAGTQSSVGVYHTTAPLLGAGRAQAWSEPALIGEDGTGGPAAIIGDSSGLLLVLYAGKHRGNGLYAVSSSDGGITWSDPALVSPSRTPGFSPGSIWLAIDDSGWFHAVWHLANELGQGQEIRYAGRNPESGDWEHEAVLARRDTDQELIGWPSILTSGEGLIVIYQDGFPPTRWVTRSPDGGVTWSSPVRPFPHTGGYQQAVPLEDGSGSVHLVLGNRLQNPEIHGMWYSRLLGAQWSPLEPIISGPPTGNFDPCCPQAVVSQGNVLLATWTNNVRLEGRTGAWFSYARLDSQELPVVPPAPAPEATATSAPEGLREVPASDGGDGLPEPAVLSDAAASPPPRVYNPGLPILIGVIPAALMGLALWMHRRRGIR